MKSVSKNRKVVKTQSVITSRQIYFAVQIGHVTRTIRLD